MAALFFSVIKYLGGAEVQFPTQRFFSKHFLKLCILLQGLCLKVQYCKNRYAVGM